MKNNILKNGKLIKFEKSHPDFKGIKFVIKALEKSKSEHRPHVKNLLFDNDRIVGTNGKQLNIYEPAFKYLNGLYDVIINSASMIILQRIMNGKSALSAYPDYKKAFPGRCDTQVDIRYECRLDFSKVCSVIFNNLKTNFIDIDFLGCMTYGHWVAEIVDKDDKANMVILENERDHLTSLIMVCLG